MVTISLLMQLQIRRIFHGRREFNFILNHIPEKLAGWKFKLSSRAGRVTLAQSMLAYILSFVMQNYLLPKGTCKAIDTSVRKFIWGVETLLIGLITRLFLSLRRKRVWGFIGQGSKISSSWASLRGLSWTNSTSYGFKSYPQTTFMMVIS